MIKISDKHFCCGCSACAQRCPKQCITMQEDLEGFLYPVVNQRQCINCGICEKVCPAINKTEPLIPQHVIAAQNNHETQRKESSSGGIFIAIAEKIIEKGGVVFGCDFDNNWETYHHKAETKEELIPLMRSKYIQSRIGNTFKEAEQLLRQNRLVLFAGTPCQISGLTKFLHKDYPNLITLDFICHGTPSPKVWRSYLKENVLSTFTNHNITNISYVNFREKKGYGWKKFGFTIKGKIAGNNDIDIPIISEIATSNPFMKGFLSNIYLRPSCYQCPAKGGCSTSDLTIADYWCVDQILPEFYDDDMGISLVFINTEKGSELVAQLNIKSMQASFTDTIEKNKSYYISVNEPRRRSIFFKEMNRGKGFNKALEQYYKKSTLRKLKDIVKRIIYK